VNKSFTIFFNIHAYFIEYLFGAGSAELKIANMK
jgi:hypothetical protein